MTDYSLKRHFDGGCARILAEGLSGFTNGFDGEEYAREVDAAVGHLELKDRVLVLANGLRKRLPASYPEAIDVLVASLGPELDEGEGMFNTSWFLMPVARFVEEYGLDHPENSLAAIEAITRRHTGEYAIRPYLRHHHDLTMQHVHQWAFSESHNVRRLASEGIRPRLPWAPRHRPFVEDPTPVIDVIHHLIDDPSLYVRKSVANNLNDISRDHADLAERVAMDWLTQSPTDRTRWIVGHGMRTLVKAGRSGALQVVGASADPAISVQEVTLEPATVRLGEDLIVHATVANDSSQTKTVVVDYSVHFLGRDGTHRPKVFKLTKVTIAPSERVRVSKAHRFRSVRTRTHYFGRQRICVQANGAQSETVDFILEEG